MGDAVTGRVVDIRDYDVDLTGSDDCRTEWQTAINDAYGAGGGYVLGPYGRYAVDIAAGGSITVPAGVHIGGAARGPCRVGKQTVSAGDPRSVTLAPTFLVNASTTNPAFHITGGGSSIENFAFYEMNQTDPAAHPSTAPVAHTWTITSDASTDCVALTGLTMFNPYQAIYLQGDRHSILDCLLGPIQEGVKIDSCTEPFHIDRLEFFPLCEQIAGILVGITPSSAVGTYIKANLTALRVHRADAFDFGNITVIWGKTGIVFDGSPGPYGQLTKLDCDGVQYGIDAVAMHPDVGVHVSSLFGYFTQKAVWMRSTAASKLVIDSGIIWLGSSTMTVDGGQLFTPGKIVGYN